MRQYTGEGDLWVILRISGRFAPKFATMFAFWQMMYLRYDVCFANDVCFARYGKKYKPVA